MTEAIGKEILENGLAIEWAWCPEVESPRVWEDNLGHMLTWSRGCDSPDENPWADSVDFVADMLCERFTFAELHEAVSAGKLGSLRLETGEDGEERLFAWYKSMITGGTGWDEVEEYWDYRDKETLARAIAECAEAPSLLQEKIVLKKVYRMEHSSVAYSTGSFGDRGTRARSASSTRTRTTPSASASPRRTARGSRRPSTRRSRDTPSGPTARPTWSRCATPKEA